MDVDWGDATAPRGLVFANLAGIGMELRFGMLARVYLPPGEYSVYPRGYGSKFGSFTVEPSLELTAGPGL